MDIQQELQQLREELTHANYEYYMLDAPTMSDYEFDHKLRRLEELEAEHPEKDFFLPNQDLLRTPEYYEKTGADGYITSESYLTEKRMEGGEV